MDDLVQRLLKLDTCAVSDACDRLGLPGAVLGIPPTSPPAKIAGRVVTVKLGDANGRTARRATSAPRAIEAANAGDVIVIENPRLDAAGWGGILSAAAKTKGVAGVVCDGAVARHRRVARARASRSSPAPSCRAPPAAASSRSPSTSRSKIGDIDVNPGDLVLADGSGVVFLAADKAEEVIAVRRDDRRPRGAR